MLHNHRFVTTCKARNCTYKTTKILSVTSRAVDVITVYYINGP